MLISAFGFQLRDQVVLADADHGVGFRLGVVGGYLGTDTGSTGRLSSNGKTHEDAIRDLSDRLQRTVALAPAEPRPYAVMP